MSKQAVAYQMDDCLRDLLENNMKLLLTTHHFKVLGIVTWDRMLSDESTGMRRRWIKGLVFENGMPVSSKERVFETSLHRKNPKSGQLEDIVAHEDDLCIIMERKTFDLSDDEENFQFMPNMHLFTRVQQMTDEIKEGHRRIQRLRDENEQMFRDAEHFKLEGTTAKERERTSKELVNRLTRECSTLREKVGNLESMVYMLRAKNLEYEARMDEAMANAQEMGTIKGMTTDDQVIHAVEKKKELYQAMMDIEPGFEGEGATTGNEIDEMREQIAVLTENMSKLLGGTQQRTVEPGKETR